MYSLGRRTTAVILEGLPRNVLNRGFVTAYGEFAVRAFEMNAVDYLLKPVDRGRLRDALNQAHERLEWADLQIEAIARVEAAANEYEQATRPPFLERIPVRRRDDILIVPIKDIAAIVAEGGPSAPHTL